MLVIIGFFAVGLAARLIVLDLDHRRMAAELTLAQERSHWEGERAQWQQGREDLIQSLSRYAASMNEGIRRDQAELRRLRRDRAILEPYFKAGRVAIVEGHPSGGLGRLPVDLGIVTDAAVIGP